MAQTIYTHIFFFIIKGYGFIDNILKYVNIMYQEI